MLKKFLKSIFKNISKDYNDIENKVNIYEICEPGNPYGHVKEFTRLSKKVRYDAHRVISPIAAKLANIEIAYSATDINGNTYKFDIFDGGDYRISAVIGLKKYIKEVAHERNPN